MRAFTLNHLLFALLLAGCSSSTSDSTVDAVPAETIAVASSFAPGSGAIVQDVEVSLGQSRSEVEAALGDPVGARDLGPAGLVADYPALHMTLTYAAGDEGTLAAIDLYPGFAGTGPEGIGPGSVQEAVEAVLGPGKADAWLNLVWYDAHGVAVGYEDGLAVRMHVVPAAPGE